MNIREDEFAAKVRGYLEQGTTDLRSGVAYRLQQARAAALARVEGEAVPSLVVTTTPALSGAGPSSASRLTSRPFYLQWRAWLGLALMVTALVGYQQWTAWQELLELEDLDTQILTSDLPIDAYLDRGFQHWLKSSTSGE